MAKEIKELSKLPIEHQNAILEALCKRYEPIEIDDKVYLIPPEVNELIDNLVIQLDKLNPKWVREKSIGKEKD
tara:strand:- start:984 stop:1202 length:219 start_codon:yes stop_codon:yes gene_type:complete